MDINCTYHCEHQSNGKCNLMAVEQTYFSSVTTKSETGGTDCPYYSQLL